MAALNIAQTLTAEENRLVEEILLPFRDNDGQFADLHDDLVRAFQDHNVEIRETRMTPWSIYRNVFSSIRHDLQYKDYRVLALDIAVGGLLQAVPAYVYTDFQDTGRGSRLKSIEFNYTGIVLEPLSLISTYLAFGVPIPVVNILNWVYALCKVDKSKIHEWNHAFDKYVLQDLYERGRIHDVRGACALVQGAVEEPPYRVPSFPELRARATELYLRVARPDLCPQPERAKRSRVAVQKETLRRAKQGLARLG